MKPPLKSGHAGRGWHEGFMAGQAMLTFPTLQSSSYACTVCANSETIIDDLFELLNQVKPSKVVVNIGQHNVSSSTLADKEKCIQFLLVLLLVAKY